MVAAATRQTPANGARPDVPAVRVIGLRKTYGDVVALERLDVEVWPGELPPASPCGAVSDWAISALVQKQA